MSIEAAVLDKDKLRCDYWAYNCRTIGLSDCWDVPIITVQMMDHTIDYLYYDSHCNVEQKSCVDSGPYFSNYNWSF